jgi:hypothetical protein
MSDDENSGSDSDVEEIFPRKTKKPFKKSKVEELDEISDEESIHSDDDDDLNDDEDSDLDDSSDVEESDLIDANGETKSSTHASNFLNMDYEEEDEDADYLQRFDESTKKDIIAEHHPELQVHNYNEVLALSRIVKDETEKIIDPLHKTIPFLTKYEKARILGERAKQLNSGAESFVKVGP